MANNPISPNRAISLGEIPPAKPRVGSFALISGEIQFVSVFRETDKVNSEKTVSVQSTSIDLVWNKQLDVFSFWNLKTPNPNLPSLVPVEVGYQHLPVLYVGLTKAYLYRIYDFPGCPPGTALLTPRCNLWGIIGDDDCEYPLPQECCA